jgi:hypothetical protein
MRNGKEQYRIRQFFSSLLVSLSKTPRIEIPSAPRVCPEAFPIKASDHSPRINGEVRVGTCNEVPTIRPDLCIIIGHHKATSGTYLHGPYQAARFEAGGAGARSIRPLIFLHAICDMGISQEESHGVLDHSRAECSMRSCRYNLFPRHSRSTVRGPCAPIQLEEMAFPSSQRLAGGALSGRLCPPRSQR